MRLSDAKKRACWECLLQVHVRLEACVCVEAFMCCVVGSLRSPHAASRRPILLAWARWEPSSALLWKRVVLALRATLTCVCVVTCSCRLADTMSAHWPVNSCSLRGAHERCFPGACRRGTAAVRHGVKVGVNEAFLAPVRISHTHAS